MARNEQNPNMNSRVIVSEQMNEILFKHILARLLFFWEIIGKFKRIKRIRQLSNINVLNEATSSIIC